jgi:acyl carrier protein
MVTEISFISIIQQAFEDTPPELIDSNTEFQKLQDWSSLTVLSIIVLIEENFSVILNVKQINESKTVKDLFNLVYSATIK